jgi:hypothetical protein
MALEQTRAKVESLFRERRLSRREAERMYESLFLNAFTAFEGFIEDLFLGLLVNNKGLVSSRSNIRPLISVNSHAVARKLVLGGRQYVDWLPFRYTLERAELFFSRGLPFGEADPADRAHVTECVAIRNVIAHRSRHSIAHFERTVLGSAALPPRERTPAGYLRSKFRTSPDQTRQENLVTGLLRISRRLAR